MRPGMYIVKNNTSWIKSPYLYSKEGFIHDQDEINNIIAQGYAEAFYDPDRSSETCDQEISPHDAFAAELPKANNIYYDACEYLKELTGNKTCGSLEAGVLKHLVNEIIQSLDRNFNALLFIANIKGSDDFTYRHSINVAIYAVAYARFLELEDDDVFCLGLAGLFHDYGKALVPQEILTAPRSLTDEEFKVMHSHVTLGYECLKKTEWINSKVLDGVLHHHERHDGAGYPNKLSGDQVSIYGRVISICDTYDALTSKRSYKDAIHPTEAVRHLFKLSGEAWRPGYAEYFIKMIGIFPVGSVVKLSNGVIGIVCHPNFESSLRPTILVIQKNNKPYAPYYLKLAQHENLAIDRVLLSSEITDYCDSNFYNSFINGISAPHKHLADSPQTGLTR